VKVSEADGTADLFRGVELVEECFNFSKDAEVLEQIMITLAGAELMGMLLIIPFWNYFNISDDNKA